MSSKISDERLAELRETAEAARPGPWEVQNRGVTIVQENGTSVKPLIALALGSEPAPDDLRNFPHIAAFDPPTVLALIAEVAEYRTREAESELETDIWHAGIRQRRRVGPWEAVADDAGE